MARKKRPANVQGSMPTRVDVSEARTTLSQLLDRVAAGETIVLTREGKPVAQLGPMGVRDPARARDGCERMRHLAGTLRLPAGVTVRDLINEGRR